MMHATISLHHTLQTSISFIQILLLIEVISRRYYRYERQKPHVAPHMWNLRKVRIDFKFPEPGGV
jgi:hypothetical protein